MNNNEKFPHATAAELEAARQKLQPVLMPEPKIDREAVNASKALKQDQLLNNKIVTKHGADNI